MKFKLDENLGSRWAALLRAENHDVETVREEDLGGASDTRIYEAVLRERRCLITLDLDFSDVLRFPPHGTAGIAVFRIPNYRREFDCLGTPTPWAFILEA